MTVTDPQTQPQPNSVTPKKHKKIIISPQRITVHLIDVN